MNKQSQKTRILFLEPDEQSFQFRKCLAQVIEALPPMELIRANDAEEALELIDNQKADVLVIDEDLFAELNVIIDSFGDNRLPIILQSDHKEHELEKTTELKIKLIPKEESIEQLHQTLLLAMAWKEKNQPTQEPH